MSNVIVELKSLISVPVQLLNKPPIKNGVKNAVSSLTFYFGLMEIFDIIQNPFTNKMDSLRFKRSDYTETIDKIASVCAKLSIVLSAGVSRPGVYLISSFLGYFVSSKNLERAFGPNTIFAVNPRHPRHILSIVAVLLALPALTKAAYRAVSSITSKILCFKKSSGTSASSRRSSRNKHVTLVALFNTITSRPVLHLGNQFGKFLVTRL